MSAARSKIVLYYDVISPYTYMGVKLLNSYRRQWPGVDVTFKPVLLGAIMNSTKNTPLFEFPTKKSNMINDLGRTSLATGIPFKFPDIFPVLTVLPMRVLTALQMHEGTEKYEECMTKDEFFVHGRNISQADVIQSALTPLFSDSVAKVQSYIQMASQADIKQAFKENTDEAIAKGAFGAPTFLIKKAGESEETLFFGSDRFELMAIHLGVPYNGLLSVRERTPKL
ncbi:hypothetical protein BGZ76_005343 [Entomortierella beljakovae]|nr:hypothetical protein BGZ76_005343 [Entomortierella beljakovae]